MIMQTSQSKSCKDTCITNKRTKLDNLVQHLMSTSNLLNGIDNDDDINTLFDTYSFEYDEKESKNILRTILLWKH